MWCAARTHRSRSCYQLRVSRVQRWAKQREKNVASHRALCYLLVEIINLRRHTFDPLRALTCILFGCVVLRSYAYTIKRRKVAAFCLSFTFKYSTRARRQKKAATPQLNPFNSRHPTCCCCSLFISQAIIYHNNLIPVKYHSPGQM